MLYKNTNLRDLLNKHKRSDNLVFRSSRINRLRNILSTHTQNRLEKDLHGTHPYCCSQNAFEAVAEAPDDATRAVALS